MAMAVDNRQQAPFGFESLRYAPPPHFTNPWVSAPASSHNQLYATSSLPPISIGGDMKPYATHSPAVSSAYSAAQLPALPMATGMINLDPDLMDRASLQMVEDMSAPRPYGAIYPSSTATTASSFAPTSAPQYTPAYGYQPDRRPPHSHPSVASAMSIGDPVEAQPAPQNALVDFTHRFNTASEAERQSFNDAIDASRGMLAMSQSEITPRNIYGHNGSSRNSSDSYGFPSTHSAHSTHSSISSASGQPSYYNSSVSEASYGDYSSASESVDMPTSRTLPRPNALLGASMPPAAHTMMSQFSSKVNSSSQKKHKCKICDKRFTRPSSLQTHMYSHTGEKPFACDVDGCGRHFSVVSNLRRHRKVHKGEERDHPSPDDDD